jgi:NAD(P)-dependent dehydrogenase (short-subunit alcohol dehydrogenase family)
MKHVVITGSSRGIGFALARRFLELGCRVTIAGRSEASTRKAADALALALPSQATALAAHACDVTKTEDLEALWTHARERAPVDVWINNAGVSPPLGLLWDVPARALEDVIDSNVRGALMGSWVAMRGMRQQNAGTIYNIVGFGSDGLMYPGALAYGASKRAVGYITKALAREAKGSGVRVCAMDPGAVKTEMVEATWKTAAAGSRTMSAVILALAVEPDEVARLLAPRLLADQRSGALVRPWNALVAWLRLFLVPLSLLRGGARQGTIRQ